MEDMITSSNLCVLYISGKYNPIFIGPYCDGAQTGRFELNCCGSRQPNGFERMRAVKNISHISLLNIFAEEHIESSFLLIQQNRRIDEVYYSSHRHLLFQRIRTAALEQRSKKYTGLGNHNVFTSTRNSCICPNTLCRDQQPRSQKQSCRTGLFKRGKKPTITPHTITSSMALHTHTYTYFCNANFIASASSASAWGLESRTRGFKAQSSQFLYAHTERNVEAMAQK